MSRLFLSHAGAETPQALALGEWLEEQGYLTQEGKPDYFIDRHPDRGLIAGEEWKRALRAAVDRCEAVLCLVSAAWLKSPWCLAEANTAELLHKPIFVILLEALASKDLPASLTQYQLCRLAGPDPLRTFANGTTFPETGLAALALGLEKSRLGPENFPFNPARPIYPGLRPLEAEDAAIFFGRNADIARALALLDTARKAPPNSENTTRLIVLLGASGAGKSSFLRAGLWPRLKNDSTYLPLPIIRPHDQAISNEEGLAHALATPSLPRNPASPLPRDPLPLATALKSTPETLPALLAEIATTAAANLQAIDPDFAPPTLLLAIDQGEELLTADAAAEAAPFLASLTAALNADIPLLVLLAIRTDRYNLIQSPPHPLATIRRQPLDLDPMRRDQYRSVIESPAARLTASGRRFTIDPTLTEQLLDDTQGADALPLLALTLQRLWQTAASRNAFTPADYEATGKVAGAIEAAAAEAFRNPTHPPAIPADAATRDPILRAAFIPALAGIDPTTLQPTRRRAHQRDLPPDSLPLLDRLVTARLLHTTADADGTPIYEIAHDSLLQHWPTLRRILDTDAAALALLAEIERAAEAWHRNSRTESFLDHRAQRLLAAEALLIRDAFKSRLSTGAGAAYLIACRVRQTAEEAVAEADAERERQLRTQNHALAETLAARETALIRSEISLLTEHAAARAKAGATDAAMRIATLAVRRAVPLSTTETAHRNATAMLTGLLWNAWRVLLSGHDGPVFSAIYSRDGSRILTASADETARIWDANTGREINWVGNRGQAVHSANFSPDGTRIVTICDDESACIWNVSTGREINSLPLSGLNSALTYATFSPDGTSIVTTSDDKTVQIWNAATGHELAKLRGHDGSVRYATFSPDGSRLVTASDDRTARTWDAATGHETMQLRGHTEGVVYAAFSPDGRRIITASRDTTSRIWDAATGGEITQLRGHDAAVFAAAFSPDGNNIITASRDKTVRRWDAASGREITQLRGRHNTVSSAAFSPDFTNFVTAYHENTARIWSVGTGCEISQLRGHDYPVSSAAFSSDGTRIITASLDNTVRIWDLASTLEIAQLRNPERPPFISAALSSDGATIVTASFGNTARIWDAATRNEMAQLCGHENSIRSATFSPDGTRVVTASDDKTARIWNTATGCEIIQLRGHHDTVSSAVFSPDGTSIVTASTDGTARVWNAATGREIMQLRGHDGAVFSAAFSQDGTHIVTASGDRTGRIWNATKGREITQLRGHEESVLSAAFSPDGTRVVTASNDKTARIWDTTGREITQLHRHAESVTSAVFSPDGTRVVTASDDKTARIWDTTLATLSPEALIAEACRRLPGSHSTLTRAEMDLIGEPADAPLIDVCGNLPATPAPPHKPHPHPNPIGFHPIQR